MKKIFYSLNIIACFALFLGAAPATAQVTVTSSDSLSCTVLCTTLTAHLTGDSPTDAGVTLDDIYSPLHAIGFTFNYYGVNYTQLVIGANGTLDFTASDAGAYDPWPISAPLLGNTSKLNNICGPWCDIDIFYTGTAVGTETYSTDGVAPFRKFVVTWCACSMFSCGTQLTTTQIILYETTNIIEVHIAQKPVCSGWNGGYAIVGVQNAAGTAATVAPGRDYPSVWTIPPHEAWRFTPVGGGTSYTVASIPFAPVPYASSLIYWYNAGTGAFLGTGDTLTVCPSVTTTYKAGALGCGADTSFGYYTVTPGGSIVVTETTANPSICGACDGTITIHGLTPGLIDTISYNLAGAPQPPVIATVSGTGTITISGLCAGSYTNIVARQGACPSIPVSATLTDPPISINPVTSLNPTHCSAADGMIVLHGLYPSHTFTVTYSYNGVAQPPISTTSTGGGTITLSGLCSGVYDNIVAAYGACITPPVGPYTLTDPPISISGLTPANPTACGVCDGSIVLSGLYPSHTFRITYNYNGVPQPAVTLLSSSAGTVTLTGLCADPATGVGVYDNIVASYTGPCASSCATPPAGPVTLTTPPPPPVFIISSKSPSQCGYCDGNIVLSPVPPLSLDTIFYSVNGVVQPPALVAAQPDSTLHLQGICAGLYTAFSVKIGPCLSPVTGSALLVNPAIVDSFTQSIHWGCKGDTVFYSNFSHSTGPLFYNWNFGDGYSDTAASPYHIFAQGVYTVTLTAGDHFCTELASIQDSLVHPLHAAFTAAPALLCQNNAVTFTDSSIGTGLSYAWYFGNGATAATQNATYTYTNAGAYKVMHIATDFIPCHDTATTLIQVDSLSPMSITLTDSVLCRSTAVTLTGRYTGIGNTGITWFFGDGDSLANQNPAYHSYDTVGTFIVSATAHFRVCKDTSASRTINLFLAPNIYFGPDTSICPGGEAIVLHDRGKAAADSRITWKWNTGQATPAITVTSPGVYWVDAALNGCHATDTVTVLKDCYMDIPNVFTPNGDGMNDYFYPRQYLTKGLVNFSMHIYNRWGQELFQTSSTDGAGWDGRFNGVDQPQGVYVFVIDATFKDGQKEHHQGNVTLLR